MNKVIGYVIVKKPAAVMELVDIGVSKSPAGNSVRVQVPPAAQPENRGVLAYIIGVALGDGNLSNPNGRATRLRITCNTMYPRLAEEIIQNLKILFPKNKVSIVKRKETYFDISVYSNALNFCLPWRVGFGPKKLQRATVPTWILDNPEYAKSCLRGLIQTDGCIYVDRGYTMVNFTNNNMYLANTVRDMIQNLGFHPSFNKSKNGTWLKYTVRLSRKSEIEPFIALIGLYKA